MSFGLISHNRAQSNQLASPLLRLPAELRNRIYDLALDLHTSDLHEDHVTWERLSLAQSSRQLFAETAPQYFEKKMLPAIVVLEDQDTAVNGSKVRDVPHIFTDTRCPAHFNLDPLYPPIHQLGGRTCGTRLCDAQEA